MWASMGQSSNLDFDVHKILTCNLWYKSIKRLSEAATRLREMVLETYSSTHLTLPSLNL